MIYDKHFHTTGLNFRQWNKKTNNILTNQLFDSTNDSYRYVNV